MSSIAPSVRAVGEVELDQLAGADVVDAGKAEPLEGMMDRLALRIGDSGLQGDENVALSWLRPAPG